LRSSNPHRSVHDASLHFLRRAQTASFWGFLLKVFSASCPQLYRGPLRRLPRSFRGCVSQVYRN
jgi:hypothetical protein